MTFTDQVWNAQTEVCGYSLKNKECSRKLQLALFRDRSTEYGITHSLQDQIIFLLFVGPNCQRRENSPGLGLPLAKAMVELHEGTLSLESDTGKGTTVFISFPAYRIVSKTTSTPVVQDKSDDDLAATAQDA